MSNLKRPDPNSSEYSGQFGEIEFEIDMANYEGALAQEIENIRQQVAHALHTLVVCKDESCAVMELKNILGDLSKYELLKHLKD